MYLHYQYIFWEIFWANSLSSILKWLIGLSFGLNASLLQCQVKWNADFGERGPHLDGEILSIKYTPKEAVRIVQKLILQWRKYACKEIPCGAMDDRPFYRFHRANPSTIFHYLVHNFVRHHYLTSLYLH